MFLSLGAKAQASTDQYPGKRNVVVSGTPAGDAKMTFVQERKDGKRTGAVQELTGKEMTRITQIACERHQVIRRIRYKNRIWQYRMRFFSSLQMYFVRPAPLVIS